MPAAFIDPAALSAPSPSMSSDCGSPPPTTSAPSRKRPRTDMSTEERKEARAHRNRIAAQNSRDRRKLQFNQLNGRVAELEEENRQLKEELSLYRSKHHPAPQVVPTFTDSTREQENEELRERVRTLEQSWESVVRMLAAQGKPAVAGGLSSLPTPPRSSASDSGNSPLFARASPTLSMLSATDGSLDEHTRHSARVGSESPSGSVSMLDSFALDNIVDKTRNTITQSNNNTNNINKSVSSPSIHKIEDNSAVVEDWFMDLLSGSPSAATAAADTDPVTVIGTSQVSAASSPSASSTAASVIARSPFEWDATSSSSDEMQTLLALLPPPDVAREELAGLGLDLGAVSATEPWTWTGTADVPISV